RGHAVLDGAGQEYDALAQQARINIEAAFAARRVLDDLRDEILVIDINRIAHLRIPWIISKAAGAAVRDSFRSAAPGAPLFVASSQHNALADGDNGCAVRTLE